MVVDEVEAKLGSVQLLGNVVKGRAPLATVTGLDVVTDIRHLEGAGIRRQVSIPPGRAVADKAKLLRQGIELHQLPQLRIIIHRIGGIAARPEQVGGGIVAAHRIQGGFLPVPLVVGVHRQVVGEAEVEAQSLQGHQHFFQLGTGDVELGRVQRVGGVDATAIEHPLAPVEHLITGAGAQRAVKHIPATEHIGIEDFRIAGRIAGVLGELVVIGKGLTGPLHTAGGAVVIVVLVLDLGVVSRRATHKGAVVLVIEQQLRGHLEYLGDLTSIEVAVAVIGVDVGDIVPAADAPDAAIGQRGVQGAADLIVQQADFDGLG